VRYAIVDGDDDGGGGGYFDVDRVTGVVRLTHPVSFREHETFNLTLRARDRAAQSPLASTTTMIVDLVPVSRNLHAPLFSDFVLQARVRENQPAGTSVMPVVAADDDVDNPAASSMDYHVVYSIRNGTGLGRFSIDSKGTDRSLCASSVLIIGPIPWGHSGPLCHALSLLLLWSSIAIAIAQAACDSSDTW